MEFSEVLKKRRSVYTIAKESPLSDEKIMALVHEAVLHVPSAFNCQSQRVAVLFGPQHDRLWDIVLEALKKQVPPDKFAPTEKKVRSFQSGYGSILYFNEDSVTANLQKQFPLYADHFPVWAEQANGMLQFALWNLLTEQGLGANLQHYNPLIDQAVRTAFDLPESWRLIAQMPFGTPTEASPEKQVQPLESRVKRL